MNGNKKKKYGLAERIKRKRDPLYGSHRFRIKLNEPEGQMKTELDTDTIRKTIEFMCITDALAHVIRVKLTEAGVKLPVPCDEIDSVLSKSNVFKRAEDGKWTLDEKVKYAIEFAIAVTTL